MRHKLKEIEGKRLPFVGTFDRIGRKAGYQSQLMTVLLKDVRHLSGEIVTNHLWFNYTKGFQALYLEKGNLIRFDARVKPYSKNYVGERGSGDYKLSHPTKIEKLPFNSWSSLIADPALGSLLKIEDKAKTLFSPAELSLLSGLGVDADKFLSVLREQHTQKLEGVKRAWSSYFDYMVRNARTLPGILEAYSNKDYARYVLLHDDSYRVDALLALRQLRNFNGDDYRKVAKQLQDDGCELQRTDAWSLLLRSSSDRRSVAGGT